MGCGGSRSTHLISLIGHDNAVSRTRNLLVRDTADAWCGKLFEENDTSIRSQRNLRIFTNLGRHDLLSFRFKIRWNIYAHRLSHVLDHQQQQDCLKMWNFFVVAATFCKKTCIGPKLSTSIRQMLHLDLKLNPLTDHREMRICFAWFSNHLTCCQTLLKVLLENNKITWTNSQQLILICLIKAFILW